MTIHSETPLRDSRKKWGAKLFARHDKDKDNGSDEMKIQRDTTVTVSNLQPQKNRSGSFGSGDCERILPKPETTASRHLHGPWALNLPAGNRAKIPEL